MALRPWLDGHVRIEGEIWAVRRNGNTEIPPKTTISTEFRFRLLAILIGISLPVDEGSGFVPSAITRGCCNRSANVHLTNAQLPFTHAQRLFPVLEVE